MKEEKKMTTRGILASAAAVLTACGAAQGIVILQNGDQINLGVLTAPGSDRKFQVWDKIFTIESFASQQFSSTTIQVVGVIHPQNPLECVGFDLFGGFGDPSPGDGIIHEFNLQYTVEIAEPWRSQGFRLKDNSLIFNGDAAGIGSYAQVDETVIDPSAPSGMQLVGNKEVFYRVGPNGVVSEQLEDSLLFNPPYYTMLEINKDAKFFAVAGGQSSASFIRQCFSQIPSPGAASLLAFGGLLAARRRR